MSESLWYIIWPLILILGAIKGIRNIDKKELKRNRGGIWGEKE